LSAAEAAFKKANEKYDAAVAKFEASWWWNKAQAKELKDNAERAVIRAQEIVVLLMTQIKEEKDRLAQGKFIISFHFYQTNIE
jgi:hypothetical protein